MPHTIFVSVLVIPTACRQVHTVCGSYCSYPCSYIGVSKSSWEFILTSCSSRLLAYILYTYRQILRCVSSMSAFGWYSFVLKLYCLVCHQIQDLHCSVLLLCWSLCIICHEACTSSARHKNKGSSVAKIQENLYHDIYRFVS